MTDNYREIKIGGNAEEAEFSPVVVEIDVENLPTEETVHEEAKVETKVEPKAETNSRYQKRVKQLLADTKEAQREAEQLRQENANLTKQMHEGSKASKSDLKTSLETNIQALTNQMKIAKQNGETDLEMDLQEQLMDAKIDLKDLTRELRTVESTVVPEYKAAVNAMPDAAVAWIAEYPLFNKDPYFRNSTIVENNQLVSEGWDPRSEEFYDELNSRLAPRFPKVFGVADETSVSLKQKVDSSSAKLDAHVDVKPASQRNTEQTVSGSSRSAANASPQRKTMSVELTAADVAQANRWNMSLEEMAKRKAFIAANKTDNGYVPIMMN